MFNNLKVLAASASDATSNLASYNMFDIACTAIVATTMNRVNEVINRVMASSRLIFSITVNLQSMNTHEPKNRNYSKPELHSSLNNLRGTLFSRKLINVVISLRIGSPVRFGQPGIGRARLDVYPLSLSDVLSSPYVKNEHVARGGHA